MRRSGLQPGQCTKCLEIFPLTSEFFTPFQRRGRQEFTKVCKRCWAVYRRQYQRGDHHKEYMRKKRATPEHRKYMRAAWRKFHAKPEYKEYERALRRKLVSTPEGLEKERIKTRRRRARINGSTRHHDAEDVSCSRGAARSVLYRRRYQRHTPLIIYPLARGGTDGPKYRHRASCNSKSQTKLRRAVGIWKN